MIYHQIRVSIKPDAPKDQVETALEYLRRMGREIDVVEYWCVGRDFGGEFEYGAMYALKDIEAYKAYMHAPLHQETDRAGLPVVDNMISQDLTDDEDPDIGDKIREIHSARFANDATLRDLVDGLGSYEGSGVSGDGVLAE
jgi:Stress responsive A/B Barrel Domain